MPPYFGGAIDRNSEDPGRALGSRAYPVRSCRTRYFWPQELMDAIVLAGGLGTRLRSVVSSVPKPMAPVGGRPFLDLLLESLKSKGITRVILSVGYMSEAIISYFQKSRLGMDLVFEVESSPLGTGGAIAAASQHVNSDCVLVLNGDTYLDLDLATICSMWPGDRTPIVVSRAVEDTK